MENRERDRVSQRTTPTDAVEVNRRTEEAKGRDGSTVEFGQHIGQAEDVGGSDDDDTKDDTIGRSTEGRH